MSKIMGKVTKKLFYSEKTNYGVYRIKIIDFNDDFSYYSSTISITGYFINLEINADYFFIGELFETNKYGMSFKVKTYERIMPSTEEGLIAYLSSDLFIGIGAKTAEKIISKLGIDAISKIIKDIDVLDTVPGFPKKRKASLYKALLDNEEFENTLVWLYSHNISPLISTRIYNKYGANTIEVISENPYVLIDEIEGIAFLRADEIALNVGIDKLSDTRIKACIIYLVNEFANKTGNTVINKVELIDYVVTYLGFTEVEQDLVSYNIMNLVKESRLKANSEEIYDYRLYFAERKIADILTKINSFPNQVNEVNEILSLIEKFEKMNDICYETEQKQAILSAFQNNLVIISGGPGTGKTTIIKGLLYVYSQLIKTDSEFIKLCAPTGKAAKRLDESTGYPAQTIHKLLGYDITGRFEYNDDNVLPVELLIIDEASMIDTSLMKQLLIALPLSVKLVIVGDANQLPSIGPGQVLKDLISSKKFSTISLTKIHRQAKNSHIISLAYDTLNGEINRTSFDMNEVVFKKSDGNDFFVVLEKTINYFLSLGYDLHNDIQILAPMYKGPLGLNAINAFVQKKYNYNAEYKLEKNDYLYYMDDKVIQLVNQYEDQIMNGDIGRITDIYGNSVSVNYGDNVVKFTEKDITNIQLAYAISIHKSQGSEFNVVILPVFRAYYLMLNRKLLYTAITRSKKHLIIIGSLDSYQSGLSKDSADRVTLLKRFLLENNDAEKEEVALTPFDFL